MKFKKNEEVSKEIIDGDVFLFNQGTQKIVSLNKVASIIWDLIEDKGQNELKESFLELFEFVDEDEKKIAEEDFENVMNALSESGCILSE